MPYKDNLEKASKLKKELDKFRPLTHEMESRIMQKFRLDWNYHSSHIEGNLLTYGETKALILFGQTAQAKPLKDHLEMTGHDEAVKNIEEVIKQERPLTESFIRELHKLILKQPYEVDAITPDGKPTKRTISIGKYKSVPNHVITKTGETFFFASPEETPAKMNDLMQWYNDNLNKTETHPVLFATEFHYRFIRIHPFDDGNGRLARLLMNFILMQQGYPPAIIKTEDKSNYYSALQQADSGQIEYFFNYVCEQVNRSLELMLKGAKGENIDDENDLDKEIALWKSSIVKNKIDIIEKTEDIVCKQYFNGLDHLIDSFLDKMNQFDDMFFRKNINYYINNSNFSNRKNIDDSFFALKNLPLNTSNTIDNAINDIEYRTTYNIIEGINNIYINIDFLDFKLDGLNTFRISSNFSIEFNTYSYLISYNGEILKENTYMIFIDDKCIKELITKIAKDTFELIKSKTNNLQ